MKFFLICFILTLVLAGCHAGPQIEDFEQAWQPEGIGVTIKLSARFDDRKRVDGELLEVSSDGLLLNTRDPQKESVVNRRIVFVPYSVMRDVDVDDLNLNIFSESDSDYDEYGSANRERDSERMERHREQLRLLSRFPQGLTQPLLDEMLEAEGQTTVDVIGSK